MFSPSVIDGEHSLEQQDSASKEVSQGERDARWILEILQGRGRVIEMHINVESGWLGSIHDGLFFKQV